MMKCGSKRRRTKDEISQAKEEEELRQGDTERKLEELAALKRREQEILEAEHNKNSATNILTEMINRGDAVMNSHGGVWIKGLNPEFDQAVAA
jgi:hypothetical protein